MDRLNIFRDGIYYPEILEEIKGIADGQHDSYDNLCTFLLSMYCFEFENHCTCFAFRNKNNIIFGRNSDFLVELEKLRKENRLLKEENEILKKAVAIFTKK